jgi:hypothetical protein
MATTVDEAADRRKCVRRGSIEQHGIVSARVKPGHDVELIDISSGGALVEGVRRLLPGTAVELFLVAGDLCASIRGRVLRCAIVGLKPTSVSYRGAIRFDNDLPWFGERRAPAAAGTVSELPGAAGRREATTQVST